MYFNVLKTIFTNPYGFLLTPTQKDDGPPVNGLEVCMSEEMLSVPEAAKKVGVCAHTIRNWIRSGTVQAYRLGPKRTIRIRLVDLVSDSNLVAK